MRPIYYINLKHILMNLDLNITWDESDKDDFIQDLFINNPKEPNKLNVLKDDNPIRLFEKLLYILNEGIHILFDIDINIDTLLDSDYKKINKYINLLGYDLLYKRCHSYKIDVLNNDIDDKQQHGLLYNDNNNNNNNFEANRFKEVIQSPFLYHNYQMHNNRSSMMPMKMPWDLNRSQCGYNYSTYKSDVDESCFGNCTFGGYNGFWSNDKED